jgi:hypothetical protein
VKTAIDTTTTTTRVGEPLPAVMTLAQLAKVLGLGSTRAGDLQRAGEFAFLECVPRVGNRPRYSGKKVQQWIDGEQQAEAEPPRRAGAFGRR